MKLFFKSPLKSTLWLAAVIAAFTMIASPASAHGNKHDNHGHNKKKTVVMKECYRGQCHTVRYKPQRNYKPPHATYYRPAYAYAPRPVYYRYPAYYNAPQRHSVIYWR